MSIFVELVPSCENPAITCCNQRQTESRRYNLQLAVTRPFDFREECDSFVEAPLLQLGPNAN